MSELLKIDDYSPESCEQFFLDTNVWMYLFCSVGNYNEDIISTYGEFYDRLLESRAKIFTTSMQISEFFNAYCKLEYNIAKQNNPHLQYKKHFSQRTPG